MKDPKEKKCIYLFIRQLAYQIGKLKQFCSDN